MADLGMIAQAVGAASGVAGGLMANTRRQQQYGDQVKLMGIQQGNQMALNRQMQEIQMENWEKTNYDAQRKQMEKAGLNTALMYGGQGGGGMIAQSGTGGSAASGNAPTPENGLGMMGIGLMQAAQTQSQIDLNKALANKANADAENTGANTETTNKTRDYLIENMRQSGISTWAENLKKKIELDPETYNSGDENIIGNTIYKDQIRINKDSYVLKQLNQDLLKSAAETKNLDASAALTNEKVKGYWQELLNATSQADSQAIQAAAQKLSAEFNTGEFTNWKTWTDLGTDAIKALGSLSGFIKPKNLPKITPKIK